MSDELATATPPDTEAPVPEKPTAAPSPVTGFLARVRRASAPAVDAGLQWVLETKHATYSFAALRILYGSIILLVLVTSFPDRHYLWGVGSRFIDPVATTRGYPWIFEAVFNKSNAVAFDVAYLLLGFLALLFTVGLLTRWVGPLVLLFWVGLAVNSTLLTNGGDTVLRITLLFALFADLGGRWSVDSWLRKAGKKIDPNWFKRIPEWVGPLAHNTALILCAYQIILIYSSSAMFKLQGTEWLAGTATYYSLVLDVFRPFPWLNDLVTFWDFPVYALTYLTLALQLLFPVLLVWRPTRIVALVGITGTHLGIGLFLGLWPFSLAMIALDFLFVRDATWLWAGALAREQWGRFRARKKQHGRRAAAPQPVASD